jgi:mRNA interferase HigB
MRIHLIKRQTIEDFVFNHPSAKSSFVNWLTKVYYSDWYSPEDIRHTFKSADLLGNGTNRVVFNIGGNNYRMICKYHNGSARVHLFICWLGTHSEYMEICHLGKQYSVNIY